MWRDVPDVRWPLDVFGVWALLLLMRTAYTPGVVWLKTLGQLTLAALQDFVVPVAVAVLVALASHRVLGWP